MRIATLLVAALVATVVVANAQTPFIAVYFDPYHTQETKDCPGFVTDTWYVAAVNFNLYITGADFKIEYPPAVTWLADLNVPPVHIGATPTGLAMGFALPQNGYNIVELCRVLVMWNCDHCGGPFYNNLVRVVPNPATGFLGVSDYPNFDLIPGTGLTSVICPLGVPAEETTWGQVKALYE